MKQYFLLFASIVLVHLVSAQNVGVGTTTPTENFHVVGNKVFFQANFVGIGTSTPTTGFTGFAMKSNANSYYGAYVDAGATGHPFYGYALNGVAKAYTGFNSATNAFEYHQSSDAIPDFFINGNAKAVFNTGFVGIGTSTPTTGFTGFAMKSNVNTYYGAYVDAGATGHPFYGYALNGVAKAYTGFNSATNAFEYHQSSDAIPDFFINGNAKAVFNTGFVGIGTSTPTTGFTGFAMKSNANSYYGAYVDAGATGHPFYGYALNGLAKAYTGFNSTNNAFEYHQTSDAIPDFFINGNTKAVFNTGFVGIGTSTPTTGFTGFAMKSNANSYYGAYVDAGATGHPFYGYALNGAAKAYTVFNSTTNAFEYHQTSDVTPDFFVNGNTSAVFNTAFVGIGTNTPTTGAAGFTMKRNVNTFYGAYVDAGPTGRPFYGYAQNGNAMAWTEINSSNNNNWELYYGGTRISVSGSSGNVGIGTNTPSQKLDVSGIIHASNLNGGATTLSTDAAGNIIRTPSDGNLKNNIADINNPLDRVLRMHGVTYNFKDANRFGSNRQMGFLAQELEKIVPEAVSSGGEYKSVNYQVLTALLAEAVKEQQIQIDLQKKNNETLQKNNLELQHEMDLLKKQFDDKINLLELKLSKVLSAEAKK